MVSFLPFTLERVKCNVGAVVSFAPVAPTHELRLGGLVLRREIFKVLAV